MLSATGTAITAWSRHCPTESATAKISCQLLDLDEAGPKETLSGRILYTVPPPADSDTDTRLARLLPALRPVDAFVYISTSGVYGDCAGALVDESRPVAPLTARARRRVDAENQLRRWAADHAVRLVILRVPGIYGPGRLPEARLRSGAPVLNPTEAPISNRVHADDLALACQLALDHGEGVFNIADGTPSSMSAYFLETAKLLGIPSPPLINWEEAQATLSPQLLSFYNESRILDISKARRELGFSPRYPNLAAGLPHCLNPLPATH